MSEFDWKLAIENAVTQSEGMVTTSTDKEISFKMRVGTYKVDFGGTTVIFSKADGTFISRFPKLPPIFAAVIKTIMIRLK